VRWMVGGPGSSRAGACSNRRDGFGPPSGRPRAAGVKCRRVGLQTRQSGLARARRRGRPAGLARTYLGADMRDKDSRSSSDLAVNLEQSIGTQRREDRSSSTDSARPVTGRRVRNRHATTGTVREVHCRPRVEERRQCDDWTARIENPSTRHTTTMDKRALVRGLAVPPGGDRPPAILGARRHPAYWRTRWPR